jgi:hypothetical protein
VENSGDIRGVKFHKILEGLDVALEATFNSGEDLKYADEFKFLSLIHNSREGLVKRVYHPARIVGNLNGAGQSRIVFLPWVENEALFHRLVFRAKGNAIRNAKFARFGENKAFGFKLERPFITLDFFGKRADQFLPLFLLFDSDMVRIDTEISETEVALLIARTDPNSVPPHLYRSN